MLSKYLKTLPFVVLSYLAIFNVYAGVFTQTDLDQAYAYVNTLRQRAAMINFTQHTQLQQAAFNHANYLADNAQTGHDEVDFITGFTGYTPSDRVIAAGFASRSVGENLTTGNAHSIESIDDLFTAIYHRLGFLSFDYQLLGIGIAHQRDNSLHTAYVYEMGNQGLNDFCAAGVSSSISVGTFFTQVCADKNLKIAQAEFDQAIEAVRRQNPNIVVWPPRNGQDTPPAFFEEDPDPLPDHSVSGNPLSIQFNPLYFTRVTLKSFKLFRNDNNQQISNTRLLDQNTDPNKKFSALEFALYPLDRLDWNTEYRAEVHYSTDTSNETLNWTFTTRNLNLPIITTPAQGEHFTQAAQSGEFTVYIPPNAALQQISGFNSRFSSDLDTHIDFIDRNTLKISVNSANLGNTLSLNIGNNQSFTIHFDQQATFNTANNSLVLPAVEVLDKGISVGRVSVQMRLISSSPEIRLVLNGHLGSSASNMPSSATYDAQTTRLSIPALVINGQVLAVTLELVADSNPLQFKLLQ